MKGHNMAASRRVKRARLEMIGDFLEFCRQPRIPQEIRENVGLTVRDLHETIVTTMAVGLLKAFDTKGLKPQYKTTDKGNTYVDLYLNLKTLLETADLARNPIVANQE